MVLVDSSVWIEDIRGRIRMLDFVLANEIATCPPIWQEVLQGAQPGRGYAIARAALASSRLLESPMPLELFERAAQTYRQCQDRGLTLRSPHDCLIAAVALRHNVPVFTLDSDFRNIAKILPLQLFTRS
ncbi:MAG: type II toxin-antitoxin system VapC family toxin [Thermoanaerobaculia bacterium]